MTLALRGIEHSYGSVNALGGVDLDVAAGQVLALLGPNGAGKSTLVGIASAVLRPVAGAVSVCGVESPSPVDVRGRVGVAQQEIGLYPTLSVDANLRAFGELAGLGPGAAAARAAELVGPFALDGLGARRAGQLSGGERRRVHAAAALVARPELVLLDEPTAGADPQTRARVLDAVRAVAADGAAVLYTTHYLPEVEALDCDVAIIDRGRIVAAGTAADLIAAHATARLVLSYGERRVEVDGDAAALPAALAEHGADGLENVEVVRPSLESAYLALTGRRT
jgi:ABC-2 type transport system ATP-binding protein